MYPINMHMHLIWKIRMDFVMHISDWFIIFAVPVLVRHLFVVVSRTVFAAFHRSFSVTAPVAMHIMKCTNAMNIRVDSGSWARWPATDISCIANEAIRFYYIIWNIPTILFLFYVLDTHIVHFCTVFKLNGKNALAKWTRRTRERMGSWKWARTCISISLNSGKP